MNNTSSDVALGAQIIVYQDEFVGGVNVRQRNDHKQHNSKKNSNLAINLSFLRTYALYSQWNRQGASTRNSLHQVDGKLVIISRK